MELSVAVTLMISVLIGKLEIHFYINQQHICGRNEESNKTSMTHTSYAINLKLLEFDLCSWNIATLIA